jgi:DNA-binding CsgD family transcriptional regulator/tetratricopeptide (TPR) repeat protein
MAVGWTSIAAGFAGRTTEQALLQRTLDAAANGSPGLVLVRGEAGIGKTSLVAAACRSVTGMQVLWGRCLQLDSLALPYLPFIGAMEGWFGDASMESREGLLEVAPGLRDVLPSLGAAGVPGSDGVPATLVRALDHCAAVRPAVVVVDDAQWADNASLDVLAYAVAGLRSQRLAVLLTARSDQLAEGDRLHGWWADIRRLPWVAELELRRMDAEETTEQLGVLLGQPPDVELVQEVLRRSEGNPYFTELLAREVDPETGQLPVELPAELRSALLSTWHRLPQSARNVTRLLAVCGHPVEDDVLVAAAETIGMGRIATGEALHAAADAGVVVLDHPRLWFRHPLLAEILLEGLLPFERVAAHAALVEALTEAPRPPRPADLARHYEGAQLFDQALAASLEAAERAARLEARDEEADLRLRAARLWPLASREARESAGSLARLWADAAQSMVWAGDPDTFEVLEQARRFLDEHGDRQRGDAARARVLRLWAGLAGSHGQSARMKQSVLDQALELCAALTEDPESAYVLVELCDLDLARGRLKGARRRAAEAVEAARRSGDPAAICWALSARVNSDMSDDAAAEADLSEALDIAVTAGLPLSEALIRQVGASLLHDRGRLDEAVVQLQRSREVALEHGLGTVAQLSGANAALLMCDLGWLAEAGALLPGVLTGRSAGWGGIEARDAALRYSLRAGDSDVDGNARRLEARAPDGVEIPGLLVVATMAEYLMWRRRPGEVLEMVSGTVAEHAQVSAAMGRELLVWAARAAADAGPARGRLEELLVAVGDLLPAPRHAVDRAWQSVLEADLARVRGREDPDLWHAAVAALGTAGLGFEQARCRLSLARCLLGTAKRSVAATALRDAHTRAGAIGAVGLVAEVERLALTARISLLVPEVLTQDSELLTRREREVLGHLVAGRTYAEIARELVISEKTVSVHVSNLLRKTGSANRVEAAQWAQRQGLSS